MSTLTKILIVLLTLATIFLCGTVVTYVANAEDYREKFDERKAQMDSLRQEKDNLARQLNDKIEEFNGQKQRLNTQISSLRQQTSRLETELANVKRAKTEMELRVSSMAGTVETANQTAEQQRQQFEKTHAELKNLETKQIKLEKELDETTRELVDKMAVIETLQAERRRLQEEKTELQNKLAETLKPAGKMPVEPTAVTPLPPEPARAAEPETVSEIGLEGTVTAVDSPNSMVEISIGSSDGVEGGMTFYVVRGDDFICELLIIDVDEAAAVGVMQLTAKQPKKGDKVSSNL